MHQIIRMAGITIVQTHQEHDRRVAHQGNGCGELSLVTSAVVSGTFCGVPCQTKLLYAPGSNLKSRDKSVNSKELFFSAMHKDHK